MIEKRYSSGKKFVKYSDDEINAARHQDMLEYLGRTNGYTFTRTGSSFTGKEHDSIVIDADRFTWHWYSRDLFGKGAIDWLMKVENYTFAEAAEHLIGNSAESIRASPNNKPLQQTYHKDDKPVDFLPPKAVNGRFREVTAYLNKTRMLPPDIITFCVTNKFIYQDEKKRAIFCGYDNKGKMKFAEAKITSTFKKYYPQNIAGSQKAYSFYIPASPNAANYDPSLIYVFEAPIDALSHGALMQKVMKKQCKALGKIELYRPDCWLAVNRLSLSGVSDNALMQRLKDNPQIKKIRLCLDNDDKGQAATLKIMQKLCGDYDVKIVKPPQGKDWNDTLKFSCDVKKNNSVTLTHSQPKTAMTSPKL